VVPVVLAVAEDEPEVVPALRERRSDLEVFAEPVEPRSVPVEIACDCLEEDAEGLPRRVPDQLG